MISVGKVSELVHPRYILSLRSKSLGSKYHSIVLYGIDTSPDSPQKPDLADLNIQDSSSGNPSRTWHAMEEECPHLGASMAEADIDIESDGVVAICPWHKSVLCYFGHQLFE